MGTTSMHREKGRTNEELFLGMMPEGTRFHACATVGRVFYAAVETPVRPGEVWAYIVLTSWSSGYFNFSYKDMDETMGPWECSAPAKVLDALTPTDNKYALEWREKARLLVEQRKAVRGLKDGDQVVMGKPVTFASGDVVDTFTVKREPRWNGKGTNVVLCHGGMYYRVPWWRDAAVAVVRDGVRTTTPVGQYAEENVYVRKVTGLLNGADEQMREAVVARYGEGARYGGDAWAARQEFRRGDLWEVALAS